MMHFHDEALPDPRAVEYLLDDIEVLQAPARSPRRDKDVVLRPTPSAEHYFPDDLGFQLGPRKLIQHPVDYEQGSEDDQCTARPSECAPHKASGIGWLLAQNAE